MNKPFGYSYFIDMYGCRAGSADNMELTYRFLEQLVDRSKLVIFTFLLL